MKQILVLAFSLLSLAGFSQKVDQLNVWYTYAGNHKIAENYKVHTLISQRRHDALFGKPQQSLVRVALMRSVNKNLIVGLGYDNAITYPYGAYPLSDNVTEHRSFERIIFKHDVTKSIKMNHRYLFEQRYVANKETKHRLRYRLTGSMPIAKVDSEGSLLKLVTFNELFVKLGNTPNKFNQNWAYLGVSYPLDKTKAINLGYMNQYLVKGDRTKIENNHTPSLSFKWDLDLTKKK